MPPSLSPPPDRALIQRHLTVPQWRALLDAAARSSLRNEALVLVMYEAALRRREPGQLILAYAQTVPQNRRLYVTRGKGSRDDYVTLSKRTSRTLLDWIREAYPDTPRPRGAPIFPGRRGAGLSPRQVYRVIHDLGGYALLPDHLRHPHVLKHSRVQHLLERAHEEGVAPDTLLQTIAELVGHASALTTIQHYMAKTRVERRLTEAWTEELTS